MRLTERNNTTFSISNEERIKADFLRALAIWQFISILLLVLVTGVFWGTWPGLSRFMAVLTPAIFWEVGHTMIGKLGALMALLMPAAIRSVLPMLYLLYRNGYSRAFYPVLAGFAPFIIALLITLIVEVPIDNQIEGWTVTSLSANWQKLRER